MGGWVCGVGDSYPQSIFQSIPIAEDVWVHGLPQTILVKSQESRHTGQHLSTNRDNCYIRAGKTVPLQHDFDENLYARDEER